MNSFSFLGRRRGQDRPSLIFVSSVSAHYEGRWVSVSVITGIPSLYAGRKAPGERGRRDHTGVPAVNDGIVARMGGV